LNSSSSNSSSLILCRKCYIDQVTSAPRAIKVSIKTAVWIVMCKHPAIREPFKVVRLYIQHEAPLNLAFQLLLVQFLSSQAARDVFYFESHIRHSCSTHL
jgi:hypothetical protein